MTDSPGADAQNSPRPRSRAATRARLLDAAAELFAEVGLGATSVEAVCERAGFTRGAFYSNFESKDEIFLELVSEFGRGQIAAVRARVESFDEPIRLDDMSVIVAILSAVGGDDRFGALLWTEMTTHAMRDKEFARAFRETNDRCIDEVAQIIEDTIGRSGAPLRVTPVEATRILLAVWADSSQRGVMMGTSDEEFTRARADEIGRAARLLVDDR
ncbi:TetR/AcrR family transcriptional regulator [Microbacterium karelineae]|uniref:TetR/AcrR family transcriptional regulator n=1 Tax=Microbacterium karelineae TaxID=2654283 RepID=UPI001E2C5532|nr:TetR/AcrR family transcriptional regulator [Microbacterium karelineae]